MFSPKIHVEPYDVDQRLAELGLDRKTFDKAAEENYAAFASCTPNHPATYPGSAAWAETNRSLAESLIIKRWGTKESEKNLPLVINNANTMAITSSSGDENTGISDKFPCTRSAKGPTTADAVRANSQQKFAFMEEDSTHLAAMVKKPGRSTWIFLVHRDLRLGEIRHELSRPISMSDDGRIDRWEERIIFPPRPFDTNLHLGDEGGSSPEITVEIQKRA